MKILNVLLVLGMFFFGWMCPAEEAVEEIDITPRCFKDDKEARKFYDGILKQQTIKNLALSGMAVRGDSGNPGGRLLSLKQSSRERFGASSNEVYLGFEPGQVYIVLYGCNVDKMKEHVTPLSVVGNRRNQHQGK